MEPDFDLLQQALRRCERNLILRETYFAKLNECYESIVFEPLPSNSPSSSPKQVAQSTGFKQEKTAEEPQVTEILMLAERVINRENSAPKKKSRGKSTKRRTKKPALHRRSKSLPKTRLEQLTEYKYSSVACLKAAQAQSECSQSVSDSAREVFLRTLKHKLGTPSDLTPLDTQVAQMCAGYKLLTDINEILEDDDVINSFRRIAGKQGDYEEMAIVCKVKFILDWINRVLTAVASVSELCPDVKKTSMCVRLEIKKRLNSALSLASDSFSTERRLHSAILQGDFEQMEKLKDLDTYRYEAEIEKFIQLKERNITSVEGLRVLHSLCTSHGRNLCTVARHDL